MILMKVGRRLREILNVLEEAKVIDHSVFVSHAGMENEQVETNLRRLNAEDPQAGYLSIILAHAEEKRS